MKTIQGLVMYELLLFGSHAYFLSLSFPTRADLQIVKLTEAFLNFIDKSRYLPGNYHGHTYYGCLKGESMDSVLPTSSIEPNQMDKWSY